MPPPPKAEKLSCSEFTAPVDVPVVEFANSAEDGMPKRTSLPSRFAPATTAAGPPGFASAVQMTASTRPHRKVITPSSATPSRTEPTMRPKVRVSETGMTSIRKISTMSEVPFGFSNGCAELALRMPPPFVPSSLIASCDATGARAIVEDRPSGPMTSTPARRLIITPSATSTTAPTAAIGSRIRTQPRVMSTHAFPRRSERARAKPRTTATATASPTAAERKFWTVSPAICTT